MQKLTTRGRRTAEAIRNREEFKTSGALSAEWAHSWASTEMLSTGERAAWDAQTFRPDYRRGVYVVYSYATPIAWWTDPNQGGHGWHLVSQKFSRTTSRHQGLLYLIPHETTTPGEFGCSADGSIYLVQPS